MPITGTGPTASASTRPFRTPPRRPTKRSSRSGRSCRPHIKAWPNDGGFKREYFKELLPVYRKAGAIKGEPDLNRVVETRFVEQALQELG